MHAIIPGPQPAAVTPLTPVSAALLVNCPQCWQVPGAPCWPWGSHLARYQRANRRGLLSDDALGAVVGRLEVIAGCVVIPDGVR